LTWHHGEKAKAGIVSVWRAASAAKQHHRARALNGGAGIMAAYKRA